MRKILILMSLILMGCQEDTVRLNFSMVPDSAEAEAGTIFKQQGIVLLQAIDSNKAIFSGAPQSPEYPDCNPYTDLSLVLQQVESIEDNDVRAYISRFNSEMKRLKAVKYGCI